MNPQPIKNLLILGGGSSGWMAAAMISRFLGDHIHITLVESTEIGTVGVGEATIPPIMLFNNVLGIDESTFLQRTQGTIKLGIQFEHWGMAGDCYMHAFGDVGHLMGFTSFHHFWLRTRQLGLSDDFWRYSLNYQAAKHQRFAPIQSIPNSQLNGLVHAYHFDAGLYAQFLREYSEQRGVTRIDGKVAQVVRHPDNGQVATLVLDDGRQLDADFFIDCSGFRALLIGDTLGVGYEDWSHWLPCNRALAVPSEPARTTQPYTRAIAHEGGWQWRIPLQHRNGNGLVYCDRYLNDDQAAQLLMSNLDTPALDQPRPIRFQTGRRQQQWSHNVVSLGLASGFLEPLESTSLHLVQAGITRLIKCFPSNGMCEHARAEYNRQSQIEFERIRDFIILHYHLNRKTDSAFWRDCRASEKPESLQQRIQLFESTGLIFREQDELFSEIAWQQVMIGQGLIPKSYHPLADKLSASQLEALLTGIENTVKSVVAKLPTHDEFLERHAKPPGFHPRSFIR